MLHCINYPTTIDNANLNSIKILKQNFKDYYIGYSDHVPPQSNRMAAMEMKHNFRCGCTRKTFYS